VVTFEFKCTLLFFLLKLHFCQFSFNESAPLRLSIHFQYGNLIMGGGADVGVRSVMVIGEYISCADTSIPPACSVDIVSGWVKQITGLYILSTLYSDKVHTDCQAISFPFFFISSSFPLLLISFHFTLSFLSRRKTHISVLFSIFVIVLPWYCANFQLPKILCFPNRSSN